MYENSVATTTIWNILGTKVNESAGSYCGKALARDLRIKSEGDIKSRMKDTSKISAAIFSTDIAFYFKCMKNLMMKSKNESVDMCLSKMKVFDIYPFTYLRLGCFLHAAFAIVFAIVRGGVIFPDL